MATEYVAAALSSSNHPNEGGCEADDERICRMLEKATDEVLRSVSCCIPLEEINQVLESVDENGDPVFFESLKCWTFDIAYWLFHPKVYRGPNGQPLAHHERYLETKAELDRFLDPEFCRCSAQLLASNCVQLKGCGNTVTFGGFTEPCKKPCGCCS